MDELIFASHNHGKIAEIKQMLEPLKIKVLSAEEIELPDVEETGTTFEENAALKALTIAGLTGKPCLADDSGVLVLGRPDGSYKSFEGRVNGMISECKHGSGGFGFDPLFVPDGYDETFAELGADIKNKISHRGRALQKFIAYLQSLS